MTPADALSPLEQVLAEHPNMRPAADAYFYPRYNRSLPLEHTGYLSLPCMVDGQPLVRMGEFVDDLHIANDRVSKWQTQRIVEYVAAENGFASVDGLKNYLGFAMREGLCDD